jgi:hypothetical protein
MSQPALDRLAHANTHRPKLWICPDCHRRVRVENAPNHASACQPLRRAATQAKKQQRNGTPTLSELLIAANNADWQQVVLNGGPPCFHFDKERQRFCLAAERWPGHGVYHPFTNLADMIGSVTS